jgi:outer membrane immunogenic protein
LLLQTDGIADFAYPWGLIMRRFQCAALAAVAVIGFASIASAADLPVKAPPMAPVAAPVYSWTGCYVGGNLGGAWKGWRSAETDNGFVEVDKTASGFVGGGQIGCDYQFAPQWVVGVQGMWDWSGVRASAPANADIVDTFDMKVRSFGTVAAKIGYLVNPTLLFYGKAGYGWLEETSTWFCDPSDCQGGITSSASATRSGFDAGLGLTWMFQPHWDLFVEWDHMWLGTKTLTYVFTGGTYDQNVRQSFDKVLVGIDYRFNLGTVQ